MGERKRDRRAALLTFVILIERTNQNGIAWLFDVLFSDGDVPALERLVFFTIMIDSYERNQTILSPLQIIFLLNRP